MLRGSQLGNVVRIPHTFDEDWSSLAPVVFASLTFYPRTLNFTDPNSASGVKLGLGTIWNYGNSQSLFRIHL